MLDVSCGLGCVDGEGGDGAHFDVGHLYGEVGVRVRRLLSFYAREKLATGQRDNTLVGSI